MKTELLLDAIGEVKDVYLLDADETVAGKRSNTRTKWWAIAACVCLAVAAMIAFRLIRTGSQKEPAELEGENSEAEISEGAPVNDIEYSEKVPCLDEETDAAFGYLFPTEIMEGYVLDENGIELFGNSPLILDSEYRALQARYYNVELDDMLLIKAVSSGYLGVDTFGTVLYGDPQTDGTRSSMIYYENDGITILYRFAKTDIAAMDPEAAERFYAMVHSAKCFDRDSVPSYEGNDEIEING